MKKAILIILALGLLLSVNIGIAKKTDNPGLDNIEDIISSGAGNSGKVPKGLLNAHGLQDKLTKCSALTVCGESCIYGGVLYNTVLIGTQCWFKENLNVGTILANTETPDNTTPTLNDPNTVSKWCYNDSSVYCTSEGGLYTWAEANALPDSCNLTFCSVSTPNQGICPTGWHIPTDAEQYTLENYLKTPGETCDATRGGYDCSNAGTKLKIGGSSGFDAIGAGNHETNGALSFFDKREPSAHFWSSSPCLICSNYGHSYNRALNMSTSYDNIRRGWSINTHGFSVRCVADSTYTPEFITKWGEYGTGNSQFNIIFGVATNNGDVYLTDRDNHRIQKFDSNGNYILQWGSLGSGNGQFVNADNIAVDNNGDVYVSDWGNMNIQKFDSNGNFLLKWGGGGSDNGQFSRPYGLVFDSSNNVYVADRLNHRIQKFDPNGNYLSQWGGFGSGDGQLNSPVSVAIDQNTDTVYVVESDSGNNRVQSFTTNGVFINKWGSYGTGPGQFIDSYGAAVDSHSYVYITDRNNHRVQIFDSSGNYINEWGGGGPGLEFRFPAGISIDNSDNIYVVDVHNHRVQKFGY